MLSDGWALAGLALSAFTSATILPGSSEAALLALLYAQPTLLWPALLTASLANTAGGLTSVWLGQRAPTPPKPGRALSWLHRHGAQAGADFDHAFVGGRVNGVHDVLDGARVLQEVLAEAFAGNVLGHERLVSVWGGLR